MPRKATKMKPVSVRAQVRYEKRRMAVEALSQGEVASDVARVMKIPRRTLCKWKARYRDGSVAALHNAHKTRPGTTWGKIGETPAVEDSGDRFSIRLISAVSPRGDMKFSSFTGRMDGIRFVNFLKKLHADVGRPLIVIPDEQVWNHAKARLAKLFVATKDEFKAALFSILLSIQRSTDLVLSFFQLPDTQY